MVNEFCLLIICLIDGIGGGGLVWLFDSDVCIYVFVNLVWEWVVVNMVIVLMVVLGLGFVVGFGVVCFVISYFLVMVWELI